MRPHGNRHGKTEEQIKHFCPKFEKEMHRKDFLRNSRSLPERFNFSWIATQNWSNWISMHPDGQICAERLHLSHVVRQVLQIQKELVDLSQHIWTQWTDETPIRLQRSLNKITPSSPWVWRRATCNDFFLVVSEVASVLFFIQHIMVAVERFLVELITFIISQAPLSPWKSII